MTTRTSSAVIVKATTIGFDGAENTFYYGPFLPHVGSAAKWFVEQLDQELKDSQRHRDWSVTIHDVFIGEDESDCEVRATR